jgi:hypothetical protein
MHITLINMCGGRSSCGDPNVGGSRAVKVKMVNGFMSMKNPTNVVTIGHNMTLFLKYIFLNLNIGQPCIILTFYFWTFIFLCLQMTIISSSTKKLKSNMKQKNRSSYHLAMTTYTSVSRRHASTLVNPSPESGRAYHSRSCCTRQREVVELSSQRTSAPKQKPLPKMRPVDRKFETWNHTNKRETQMDSRKPAGCTTLCDLCRC